MSSSSEFLLYQQEPDDTDIRKHKFKVLLSNDEINKPSTLVIWLNGPLRQQANFYITIALTVIAMMAGSSLLFLVPLYVDPAISTLASHFVNEPTVCTTVRHEELTGLANCTWSSCREGCTSDSYHCVHIYVTYNDSHTTMSTAEHNQEQLEPDVEEQYDAILLVNIKGCGYPPRVLCANFTEMYGQRGTTFPCYQSHQNRTVVLAHYQRDEQIAAIVNFFLVPFMITFITSIALCCMHCDCRHSASAVATDAVTSTSSSSSSSTHGNLGSMTQNNPHRRHDLANSIQQQSSDESLSIDISIY